MLQATRQFNPGLGYWQRSINHLRKKITHEKMLRRAEKQLRRTNSKRRTRQCMKQLRCGPVVNVRQLDGLSIYHHLKRECSNTENDVSITIDSSDDENSENNNENNNNDLENVKHYPELIADAVGSPVNESFFLNKTSIKFKQNHSKYRDSKNKENELSSQESFNDEEDDEHPFLNDSVNASIREECTSTSLHSHWKSDVQKKNIVIESDCVPENIYEQVDLEDLSDMETRVGTSKSKRISRVSNPQDNLETRAKQQRLIAVIKKTAERKRRNDRSCSSEISRKILKRQPQIQVLKTNPKLNEDDTRGSSSKQILPKGKESRYNSESVQTSSERDYRKGCHYSSPKTNRRLSEDSTRGSSSKQLSPKRKESRYNSESLRSSSERDYKKAHHYSSPYPDKKRRTEKNSTQKKNIDREKTLHQPFPLLSYDESNFKDRSPVKGINQNKVQLKEIKKQRKLETIFGDGEELEENYQFIESKKQKSIRSSVDSGIGRITPTRETSDNTETEERHSGHHFNSKRYSTSSKDSRDSRHSSESEFNFDGDTIETLNRKKMEIQEELKVTPSNEKHVNKQLSLPFITDSDGCETDDNLAYNNDTKDCIHLTNESHRHDKIDLKNNEEISSNEVKSTEKQKVCDDPVSICKKVHQSSSSNIVDYSSSSDESNYYSQSMINGNSVHASNASAKYIETNSTENKINIIRLNDNGEGHEDESAKSVDDKSIINKNNLDTKDVLNSEELSKSSQNFPSNQNSTTTSENDNIKFLNEFIEQKGIDIEGLKQILKCLPKQEASANLSTQKSTPEISDKEELEFKCKSITPPPIQKEPTEILDKDLQKNSNTAEPTKTSEPNDKEDNQEKLKPLSQPINVIFNQILLHNSNAAVISRDQLLVGFINIAVAGDIDRTSSILTTSTQSTSTTTLTSLTTPLTSSIIHPTVMAPTTSVITTGLQSDSHSVMSNEPHSATTLASHTSNPTFSTATSTTEKLPSHQNPSPSHQNPSHTYQNPSHTHQNSIPTHQNPSHTHQNSIPTHQNPSHTHQNSIPTHQNPSHTHQNPSHTYQNPSHTHQNPSHTYQNPSHTHQNPSHTHQNPSHTYQNPSPSHQNPSHTYQNPSHTHQNPSHTHQNSIPSHQNPSHTHQNPSHTHQNPSHTHQNPSHTHQNPSHTHQNPSHTHQNSIPSNQNPSPCTLPMSTVDQLQSYQNPSTAALPTSSIQNSPPPYEHYLLQNSSLATTSDYQRQNVLTQKQKTSMINSEHRYQLIHRIIENILQIRKFFKKFESELQNPNYISSKFWEHPLFIIVNKTIRYISILSTYLKCENNSLCSKIVGYSQSFPDTTKRIEFHDIDNIYCMYYYGNKIRNELLSKNYLQNGRPTEPISEYMNSTNTAAGTFPSSPSSNTTVSQDSPCTVVGYGVCPGEPVRNFLPGQTINYNRQTYPSPATSTLSQSNIAQMMPPPTPMGINQNPENYGSFSTTLQQCNLSQAMPKPVKQSRKSQHQQNNVQASTSICSLTSKKNQNCQNQSQFQPPAYQPSNNIQTQPLVLSSGCCSQPQYRNSFPSPVPSPKVNNQQQLHNQPQSLASNKQYNNRADNSTFQQSIMKNSQSQQLHMVPTTVSSPNANSNQQLHSQQPFHQQPHYQNRTSMSQQSVPTPIPPSTNNNRRSSNHYGNLRPMQKNIALAPVSTPQMVKNQQHNNRASTSTYKNSYAVPIAGAAVYTNSNQLLYNSQLQNQQIYDQSMTSMCQQLSTASPPVSYSNANDYQQNSLPINNQPTTSMSQQLSTASPPVSYSNANDYQQYSLPINNQPTTSMSQQLSTASPPVSYSNANDYQQYSLPINNQPTTSMSQQLSTASPPVSYSNANDYQQNSLPINNEANTITSNPFSSALTPKSSSNNNQHNTNQSGAVISQPQNIFDATTLPSTINDNQQHYNQAPVQTMLLENNPTLTPMVKPLENMIARITPAKSPINSLTSIQSNGLQQNNHTAAQAQSQQPLTNHSSLVQSNGVQQASHRETIINNSKADLPTNNQHNRNGNGHYSIMVSQAVESLSLLPMSYEDNKKLQSSKIKTKQSKTQVTENKKVCWDGNVQDSSTQASVKNNEMGNDSIEKKEINQDVDENDTSNSSPQILVQNEVQNDLDPIILAEVKKEPTFSKRNNEPNHIIDFDDIDIGFLNDADNDKDSQESIKEIKFDIDKNVSAKKTISLKTEKSYDKVNSKFDDAHKTNKSPVNNDLIILDDDDENDDDNKNDHDLDKVSVISSDRETVKMNESDDEIIVEKELIRSDTYKYSAKDIQHELECARSGESTAFSSDPIITNVESITNDTFNNMEVAEIQNNSSEYNDVPDEVDIKIEINENEYYE